MVVNIVDRLMNTIGSWVFNTRKQLLRLLSSMAEAKLFRSFWGKALCTVAHVINLSPVAHVINLSPVVVLHANVMIECGMGKMSPITTFVSLVVRHLCMCQKMRGPN